MHVLSTLHRGGEGQNACKMKFSTLVAKVVDFIVMQMSRVNCEKGYSRTPENDIILN